MHNTSGELQAGHYLSPPENVLYEIERHCNNYFNIGNDPNNKERNYPEAFLKLATRIANFKLFAGQGVIAPAFRDYVNPIVHGVDDTAWQKVFSRELSIYKRAKFI